MEYFLRQIEPGVSSPFKIDLTSTSYVFGRDRKCLAFDRLRKYPQVIKHHACFVRKDDDWYVADMGSPDGTYLNYRRLDSFSLKRLEIGDHVGLGTKSVTDGFVCSLCVKCSPRRVVKTEIKKENCALSSDNQKTASFSARDDEPMTENMSLSDNADELMTGKTSLSDKTDRLMTKKMSLSDKTDGLVTKKMSSSDKSDRLMTKKMSLSDKADRLMTKKISSSDKTDILMTKKMSLGGKLMSKKTSLSEKADRPMTKKIKMELPEGDCIELFCDIKSDDFSEIRGAAKLIQKGANSFEQILCSIPDKETVVTRSSQKRNYRQAKESIQLSAGCFVLPSIKENDAGEDFSVETQEVLHRIQKIRKSLQSEGRI